MATATRPKRARSRVTVGGLVREWLTADDYAKQSGKRAGELKDKLKGIIEKRGAEDERGSQILPLSEPITFKTFDGKTKIYTALKRERHVTPAEPLPDPGKAVALLKRLKLWMSKDDEKLIKEIVLANRFVTITVEVDPDAVAKAYFEGLIDEDDYDAVLEEQRESWHFIPLQ